VGDINYYCSYNNKYEYKEDLHSFLEETYIDGQFFFWGGGGDM